jgi:hypothetical protein
VIAANEQLRDNPGETLPIRKGAALILRGTGKSESVDLLFWSEHISSVFLYSKISSGQRNNFLSSTEFWTMTDLIKNWKYEFYVTANAEVFSMNCMCYVYVDRV